MSTAEVGAESAVTLRALPVMASVARAHVAHCWDNAPRLDDALIIASELATNAIVHGRGTQFTVAVRFDGGFGRIEVTDAGRRPYAPRPAPPDAEHGRGLGIVATLADDYGHDRTAHHSTTWAALDFRGQA